MRAIAARPAPIAVAASCRAVPATFVEAVHQSKRYISEGHSAVNVDFPFSDFP